MIINNHKIILASLNRSGTSYICNILSMYYRETILRLVRINPELGNFDEWRNNQATMLSDNARVVSMLKLDTNNIDKAFVKRVFLHRLLVEKVFAFKYFNTANNVVSMEEMTGLIRENGFRVVCLYRQNILDYIISNIVTSKVGFLDFYDGDMLFSNSYDVTTGFDFTYHVECYQYFDAMITELHRLDLIEQTITYESLTFDANVDLKLFFDYNLSKTYIGSDKIVTPELREHVLDQNPFIRDRLAEALASSNIIFDECYNYTPTCLSRSK